MTSAASNSPGFSDSSKDPKDSTAKETPPKRPKLVSPPRRPRPPVEAPEATPSPLTTAKQADPETPSSQPQPEPSPTESSESPDDKASRLQPIAPPSEPMQYRAIGTVRGTYIPDDESQFNRGRITTAEGCNIEAVLLGRVTSLVKNHLDLERSHIWVVYPRTRQAMDEEGTQELHLQIVGVWEPETLGLPGEESAEPTSDADDTDTDTDTPDDPAAAASAPEATDNAAADGSAADVDLEQLPAVNDNYFSIRGEVLKYEEDEQLISIKILQNPRRGTTARKAFRLTVQGQLTGRTVGYFWDLDVKREDNILVLNQGHPVGIVPPKKKKKRSGGGKGAPRRSGGYRPGGSDRPRPSRTKEGSPSNSKVVIKRSDRNR